MLLPVALAAGLLAFLFTQVNLRDLADRFKSVDPVWLPAILAANLASDWFRALRWKYLLSPLAHTGAFLLFAASQVGSAVNLLLPFRAGEAVRVRIVGARTGVSASSIVGTLFGEVVSDLLTFLGFLVVGFLVLKQTRYLWPLAVGLAVALAAAATAAFLLARRSERAGETSPETGRIEGWIVREFRRFQEGLGTFRDAREVFNVMWSALGVWLLEALMFYLCGQALDLDLAPEGYLLIVVAANVAGSIPLTVAGIGVFEVTLTAVLAVLGVDGAAAAAFAIFAHLLLTLPHIVTGPLSAAALHFTPSQVMAEARPEEGRVRGR